MLLPKGEQTGASCREVLEAAPGRSTARLAGARPAGSCVADYKVASVRGLLELGSLSP